MSNVIDFPRVKQPPSLLDNAEIKDLLSEAMKNSIDDFEQLEKLSRESKILYEATEIRAWGPEATELTKLVVRIPFHHRTVRRAFNERELYLDQAERKLVLKSAWPAIVTGWFYAVLAILIQLVALWAAQKGVDSKVKLITFFGLEGTFILLAFLAMIWGFVPWYRIRRLYPFVCQVNQLRSPH